MIKKLLIIYASFILNTICFGQAGYFGKKNFIDIEFNLAPSFSRTYRISKDHSSYNTRFRYFYPCYSVGLSRTLRNNFEMSFKYQIAYAHSKFYNNLYIIRDTFFTTNNPQFVSEKELMFVNDPGFLIHKFSLQFKLYGKGSIAPVGKYVAFSMDYGISNFLSSEDIYVGMGDVPVKDGYFKRKQDLLELDTLHTPENLKTKSLIFSLSGGYTIPITDILLFNISFKFPLIKIISINDNLFSPNTYEDNIHYYYENDSFEKFHWITMKKYSGPSINFGLKIAI